VSDVLTEILGYDKYQEVTTELSVRSTFCDLAIKIDGRLQYLIEVKSIGTELKENHLRQAIEYGAREGIEWILLANGHLWQAQRIRFEQPIEHDLVSRSISFRRMSPPLIYSRPEASPSLIGIGKARRLQVATYLRA
jgi:hypothetical protein